MCVCELIFSLRPLREEAAASFRVQAIMAGEREVLVTPHLSSGSRDMDTAAQLTPHFIPSYPCPSAHSEGRSIHKLRHTCVQAVYTLSDQH